MAPNNGPGTAQMCHLVLRHLWLSGWYNGTKGGGVGDLNPS